ncbi:MAG TPA: phenylalanine--tRNA ligase subunit beta [Dehalococcoidia bacterium]|nr:phenylalanine--tRNA ligase subunit beta [Dehalococcoidia bacterium]
MRVPLSWLKEYVDVAVSAQELGHRLTMAGVEAGDIIELGGWTGCYVGQVLEVEQHPNADRLSLCQVDIGPEQMQVVCGAPNVAAGQKVCFARVGAYLYNPHSKRRENLKSARIRGVVSEGMICSELELGLGDGHEGIVVLPEDAPVGTPLDSYLGDTVIDLEVTANRLDCYSILGVAHEVAAITGQTVREPDISYPEGPTPITELATVSVADPDLCPRYTASVVGGITIGDSPRWLQDRLTRAGLRPINNVVDVTNYVMLEFNQPLHAFDLDKLRDQTIIVRRARPGETLATLDGIERKLNSDVLVIADSHEPVGIGGIIGGGNSEIGPDTRRVLLESATFDPYNNRKTAETFRLRTDATQRFEKGLRPELAPIALRRATQLIQQVSGGEIARGIIDIYPGRDTPHPPVPLTLQRLKQVLGMGLDIGTAARVLQSLGIKTEPTGTDRLEATVPYWRNDINIEEDLIEEVVRIIGYDAVPTTMLSTPIPNHRQAPMTELKRRIREAAAAAGLQETISYPLVSLESLAKVNQLDQDNLPLRVTNPMSVGQEYLRPTLRVSLLQTLLYNQEHLDAPFRLFEVGRAFLPRKDALPEEQEVAAGVVSGPRSEPSWLEQDGHLDFFDAKGMVSSALQRLGITATYQPTDDPTCQPGRCARISAGNTELGIIGEVHPEVRARLGLKSLPVVLFELQLEQILKAGQHTREGFRPLSRFPAATRDLALIVAADVPAGNVQDIIRRHRLVERVELFDVYTGDNIPAATKSLAWHVFFQSHERTLTNEEVNRTLEGLLRTLEREVGATLRRS